MSQQGVDYSKKISKMKILFWFDFQRCSHGPSKIGHHFRKQSGSKIEFLKKMTITKNFLLNWYSSIKKRFRKILKNVYIKKLTLKVRYRLFLTTHVNICERQIKNIFLLLICLLKSSPWWIRSAQNSTTEVTLMYLYSACRM